MIHTVKEFSVVSEAEVNFFEIPFLYMYVCMCMCVYIYMKWKWKLLSHVQLCTSPWTIQSMEFSRPEYWSV